MEGATSSICLGIADHGICFDFAKSYSDYFPFSPLNFIYVHFVRKKFYPGEFDHGHGTISRPIFIKSEVRRRKACGVARSFFSKFL